MTNPQYGFGELAAAQSQPEVTVNAMARAITRATSGEIVIDFQSDADYELQASSPLDPADEATDAIEGPDARDPSRTPTSRGTKAHEVKTPDEQQAPEAEVLEGVNRADNEQRFAAQNQFGEET